MKREARDAAIRSHVEAIAEAAADQVVRSHVAAIGRLLDAEADHVPGLGAIHLTPLDRAVLEALDPRLCKDVENLHQRTGRSAGRIRESLARLARSVPAYVVKLGGGYRLTEYGVQVAKDLEADGVALTG